MEEEEAKREFVDWMKATKTKTKNKKGGEAEEEEEEEDAEMEPNGRRATLKHRGSIIAFAAWGDGSKLRPISSSSSSSQKPNVTPKKPNKKKHTPHSLYSPSSSSSSSSASSSEEEEEDEEQQHVTTAERKKKMKPKQGSIISWQAWGQGNKLRPSAAAATTKAASASKHQKKEKQQRLETFRRKMRKLSQGEKHTEAEAEAEEEAKEEEEEGQERINMDEEGEEEEASSSEEEEEEEGSSSSSSSSAMSTISEPENENVDEEDDEEKVRKMVIVRRVFNRWRDKTFTERELQLQERRKRRSKSPPSNKDKTSGHRPHSSRTGIKDRASRNRIYRRYRRPNLLYKGVYSIEDLWSRYFWWCAYLTGTMKEWSCLAGRFWPLDFLDYTLRGSGQVYFTNNPITGLFLLIGIFAEDAYLGVCALLGLVSSTTFAVFLGVNKSTIRGGLFGYNGLLTGAALGLFVGYGEWDWRTLLVIIPISWVTVFLQLGLGNMLIPIWRAPPFTMPFNFATWIFLIAALNYAHWPLALPSPSLPDHATTDLFEYDFDALALFEAVFKGIGQVCFAESTLSGVLMLIGLAVCSRIVALFAILGSAVGILTGFAMGANQEEIEIGLWGYNPVLGTIAIGGMFFVLNWRSAILALFCGALCSLLFGTFKVIVSVLGMPALTFPFCVGAFLFVLMQGSFPGLVSVSLVSMSSPEGHLRWHRLANLVITALRQNAEKAPKQRRRRHQLNVDKHRQKKKTKMKSNSTKPMIKE